MKGALTLTLAALCLLGSPCAAEIAPEPAPARVLLELTGTLRSGEARVGQRVHFRVVEPVARPGGAVLLPAGALALGTVTESRGAGRFGKRGSLEVSVDHAVGAAGEVVPLRVPRGDGRTAQWLAGAGGGLPGKVVSFFGGGRNVVIQPGTRVEAVLDLLPQKAPAPENSPTPRTLVLKNGDRITGVIHSFKDDVYTVQTALGTLKIRAQDVQEVLGQAAPPPAADRFRVLD